VIADRITVLRRGRSEEAPPTASEAELASMMVGRTVILEVEGPAQPLTRAGGVPAVNDDRAIARSMA
jgi:simple sugar transport system ATP-binding protein